MFDLFLLADGLEVELAVEALGGVAATAPVLCQHYVRGAALNAHTWLF